MDQLDTEASAGDVAVTTAELTAYESHAPAEPLDASRVGRNVGAGLLAALPALLTLYLSFEAGGFYPASQGVVVALLAGVVALRMVFVKDPFAGFSRPLLLAVLGLGVYSVWSLLSAHWSHAPARALLDFDLTNVYLFALVLFGSSARSDRRVRWMIVLTWLAMLAVCIAALATRLRPDLFPVPANMSVDRLAYPLGYWNALGLFAAIGITLALHLGSSTRHAPLTRVLATAAIPLFAVTILLTYSRGAIVVGAGGLLAYAFLARPRGLLGLLLSAAPASTFAIAETYQAKLISNGITTAAAVQEGRHLTTSILAACLAAGLVRVALLELDGVLARFMLPWRRRRNARFLLGLICAGALVGAWVGFGGQIAHEWSNFTKSDTPLGSNDVRSRLGSFRIGGRLEGWDIAIASFNRRPLDGEGAGTFPIDWYQQRTNDGVALNAHSLYLEAMGELGIVGISALAVALTMLIGACFLRSRRSSRSLWIALGVVGLVWAVHSGIDWDWEMPAVTLPVVALLATGVTRRSGRTPLRLRYQVALRSAVALASVAALIVGVRLSVSDARLNASVAAFNDGNCPAAVAHARATIATVSSRPQPYQIIGLCDVVEGDPRPAVGLLDSAVTRDPRNWLYRYSLALTQAANGENPRPELQEAELLDPLDPMISSAARSFASESPRRWARTARRAQMLVTSRDY